MSHYIGVSDHDGNNRFPLASENAEDATEELLQGLGYHIVSVDDDTWEQMVQDTGGEG